VQRSNGAVSDREPSSVPCHDLDPRLAYNTMRIEDWPATLPVWPNDGLLLPTMLPSIVERNGSRNADWKLLVLGTRQSGRHAWVTTWTEDKLLTDAPTAPPTCMHTLLSNSCRRQIAAWKMTIWSPIIWRCYLVRHLSDPPFFSRIRMIITLHEVFYGADCSFYHFLNKNCSSSSSSVLLNVTRHPNH